MKLQLKINTDTVTGKATVLALAFIVLALAFAFLRTPISHANNWILMRFNEGHVTNSPAAAANEPAAQAAKDAAAAAPKMKLEQLKGAGSSDNAASGATDYSSDFKGVPKFTLEPLKDGTAPKGYDSIMKWAVLAPFPYARHPKREGDICFPESVDIASVEEEAHLNGTGSYGKAKWLSFSSSQTNGHIDLRVAFPNDEYTAAYAIAVIDSPSEIKNVVLRLGSDDYAKVWVNGDFVYKYNEKCRGCFENKDISNSFTLNKGENWIVFKCVQITGGWEFQARLVDNSDGHTLYLNREVSYIKK